MLRHLALAILLLNTGPAQAADGLTGLWLTQDHDGVMKVSSCNSGLCVAIAGVILDQPTDPTPVDYRGVSQCHLQIVSDARQIRPNLWKGHIMDPRNGSIYGVELHLDPQGNLALRGFLGIPLLGETQTWTRYGGSVPEDCRLPAGAVVAAKATHKR
jgi:uncharacterized protein (DUF2147 family)